MGMNSKNTCLRKHASGPKQGTTGPQNAYTIGSEQIAVTNVNEEKRQERDKTVPWSYNVNPIMSTLLFKVTMNVCIKHIKYLTVWRTIML